MNICKNRSKQIITDDEDFFQNTNFYKDIRHNHNYELIHKLTGNDIKAVLSQLFTCHEIHFENDKDIDIVAANLKSTISIINAFCHPDIISNIKNKFLQE